MKLLCMPNQLALMLKLLLKKIVVVIAWVEMANKQMVITLVTTAQKMFSINGFLSKCNYRYKTLHLRCLKDPESVYGGQSR